RDPVIMGAQELHQFRRVFLGDDAYAGQAKRELLLDGHADERTGGKPSAVRDVADKIGQVVHDLPDGHEPDDNLEEPDERREVLDPLRHEDDPDGVEAHVTDTGAEYQERYNDKRKNTGGKSGFQHSYLSYSAKEINGLYLPPVCRSSCPSRNRPHPA